MKICSGLAVAFVAAFAVNIAAAQDRPEDYAMTLKTNCAKEIGTQCKGIVEGRGRLLACLYSHDSKLSPKCGDSLLSPKCGDTVYGSMERWGMMLAALANVTRVCEADARRLCNGVQPGNGNLIDCLGAARKSVSAKCNATLDMAFLRP
jgi:hypothetical protein